MNTSISINIAWILAIFTLAGVMWKALVFAEKLHRDFLYFMAEHEMLIEDFADRKEIERHNVKTMAMAAVAAKGNGYIRR